MKRDLQQNRTLWKLVGQLAGAPGMNKERAEAVMREICAQVSGQSSTRALTAEQAEELIARLEGAVQKSGAETAPLQRGNVGAGSPRPHRKTSPEALITTEQEAMIQKLFGNLGWNKSAQQRGFYRRVLGADALFPVTHRQGRDVIEGLKQIWLRKNKNTVADAVRMVEELWQRIQNSESRITNWERGFLDDLRGKIEAGKKLTPAIVLKLTEIHEKRIAKK